MLHAAYPPERMPITRRSWLEPDPTATKSPDPDEPPSVVPCWYGPVSQCVFTLDPPVPMQLSIVAGEGPDVIFLTSPLG